MLDTGLQNRVAIVTGANNPHGIGAGIARALAAQGVAVFLHYYRTQEQREAPDSPGEAFYQAQQTKTADAIVQEIEAKGGKAACWEADLSEPTTFSELFNRAETAFGPVEILVNNAAYWEADTFLPPQAELHNRLVELWTSRSPTITARAFDQIFAVNTRAVALLMAEFAQRHLTAGRTWGRILNISTDGAFCFPSEITYGASKLAQEGYMRSAAEELARFGMTVNTLSLGPIQTGWITPELEQAILPTIPVGRIGTPEDVADAAVLIASEQARWITGQVIHVGGGHCML